MTISELAAGIEAAAQAAGSPYDYLAVTAEVLDNLGHEQTRCSRRIRPPWGRDARGPWLAGQIKKAVAAIGQREARAAARKEAKREAQP